MFFYVRYDTYSSKLWIRSRNSDLRLRGVGAEGTNFGSVTLVLTGTILI
jgi:hypothetical protein